jgi:hypothetical protein
MKFILALLAAWMLVNSTVADSSTRALTAAVDPTWAEPVSAEVSGGMCVGLPKVPYFASMADCKVPAAIGYSCTVTCSKA